MDNKITCVIFKNYIFVTMALLNKAVVCRYGLVQKESQELEVVLQYVEEKEKLEEKHLLPDTLKGFRRFSLNF
jgi:hypothetical protein